MNEKGATAELLELAYAQLNAGVVVCTINSCERIAENSSPG
ncbi:protein of unknown function [Pseudomonas mediterranea]